MAKQKIDIETTLGIFNRTDKDFWGKIYKEYLELRSLVPVAKRIGVDVRLVTTIFKELGFRKMASAEARTGSIKKDYVETSKGKKYYLEDKEFWNDIYYSKYIEEGYSENRLADYLDISRKQLRRVFSYNNYPPKSKEDIKKTIETSSIEIYGTNIPSKNTLVKNKISKSHLNKDSDYRNRLLGDEYCLLDEYKGLHESENGKHISWMKYRILHKECGHIFDDDFGRAIRCPKCYPNYYSKKEDYLRTYIESLDLNSLKSKLSDGKEIDILIPELNIGFEYNGTFWHSSKFSDSASYHKNKTVLALQEGIKLYHIWEHDNIEIVKSMIKSKLGKIGSRYYARKLAVREVSTKERQLFFDTNHLHGDVKSKFALGLYNEDELISCISFRAHKEGIEIARFATKLDSSVVGGFSKLLKHSIPKLKSLGYSKIITYCDRDWTPDYRDSTYFKNGFKFVGDTGVQLRYYNSNTREVESRETYQKHKLGELFPDTYKDDLTAEEILKVENIYSINNSGNWKFELNI